MRNVKRFPKASEVEDGAVVLWANPSEQKQLRTSLVGLLVLAAGAGVAIGATYKGKKGKRRRKR